MDTWERKNNFYIGLMSGTSADGINAALVNFKENQLLLCDTDYTPFSPPLRQAIIDLNYPSHNEINRLSLLDVELGKIFATAVHSLLKKNGLQSSDIIAIGSHGQTIRHQPHNQFTLQIGDPNIIAAKTGITTIADFRRRDIALGGQGAPLVPAFHQAYFADPHKNRIILNIGGISNITLLLGTQPVLGFDPGPGNTLLDAWIQKHNNHSFDQEGRWAASGTMQPLLLKKLLEDTYFSKNPPKSAAIEYFNLAWLEKFLTHEKPVDVQTTLVELTATCIVDAITKYCTQGEIFVCGGGYHNQYLIHRLKTLASSFSVHSTATQGIDPDWVEAIAFAWLAHQTLNKNPGNICAVTGAQKRSILGGVYFA